MHRYVKLSAKKLGVRTLAHNEQKGFNKDVGQESIDDLIPLPYFWADRV